MVQGRTRGSNKHSPRFCLCRNSLDIIRLFPDKFHIKRIWREANVVPHVLDATSKLMFLDKRHSQQVFEPWDFVLCIDFDAAARTFGGCIEILQIVVSDRIQPPIMREIDGIQFQQLIGGVYHFLPLLLVSSNFSQFMVRINKL